MYHQIGTPHCGSAASFSAHPGATLFVVGDPCRHAVEILTGIVRAVNHSREGHCQITAFFFAEDVIGLPLGNEHRYTCEAVTDLIFAPYVPDEWGGPNGDGHGHNSRFLSDVWREDSRFIERGLILGRSCILARTAAFLIAIAPKLRRIETTLEFPLPQIDIASYLGTSPETVCRTLRQLREMGVIAMPKKRRLSILSANALYSLAEGAG